MADVWADTGQGVRNKPRRRFRCGMEHKEMTAVKSTASARKRAIGIALAVVLACTYIIVRTYLDIYPSADMTYRSANYEVEVQRNGDLKIREHIDVTLKKRGKPWRQLYQQYRLDPD